jgi:hypothetical protein
MGWGDPRRTKEHSFFAPQPLKLKAKYSSETWESSNPVTQRNIPEDLNCQNESNLSAGGEF